MRDCLKILLAVGGGVALALVIALPLTLTGDDAPVAPEDPGAQRFPETNFLTYEDYWNGVLSYKGAPTSYSSVNPDHYLCTVNGTYYKRPIKNYAIGTEGYDDCDGSDTIQITQSGFAAWRTEQKMIGCSLSEDEKFVYCYKNRMKQWRHSYYADYYVYDVTKDTAVSDMQGTGHLRQAQFCGWAPKGHNFICVSNDKNIYLAVETDDEFSEKNRQVTNDGGWCLDSTRIMDVVYEQAGGASKCIFNGVPDWNYEEEMIGGRSTIYWSPNADQFNFVSFDVSEIELLEYSVYPEHTKASSADEVDQNSFEQYPRMNQIQYAKTAGKIAKTKMYHYDIATKTQTEINKVGEDGSLNFDQGIGCTLSPDQCENEASQENRWFTGNAWSPDGTWFLSTWTSRDATQSKGLACQPGRTPLCQHAGREDGGIKGHYEDAPTDPLGRKWVNDEGSNGHGWVGNFGPFAPILTNTFSEYFSVYSYKVDQASTVLHPYDMSIKDGYWNVAKVTGTDNCDSALCGTEWLTDSRDEKWVVTGLNWYDEDEKMVYFTAARGTEVGTHETTEQRKRHILRVATESGTSVAECVTCPFDEDNESCETVSMYRSCADCGDDKYHVLRCGGPDYPRYYMLNALVPTTDVTEWIIMEDNRALKKKHTDDNLGRTKVIYGVWLNEDYKTYHNYEMFVPADFDENAITKKYPLFLEVYAGPEFQKISGSYKSSGWPQVHLPGAYDCITVSVDGRGSAFQGDEFMFANYKALSQTERVDQTEFVRWFTTQGPYANIIDKTRVSVYGWSYGGYTTTNIIGYGGGDRGKVFTSGVAVAPLADWRMYDAMYAERYMGFNGVKDGILEPHWINSSMVERNMNENKLAKFREAEYHLIHGTNDDNVHFLSAAQMEKALVSQGIDFENFFYADEDHSIGSTNTVKSHIYRNIITRIIHSWGYTWNGDNEGLLKKHL